MGSIRINGIDFKVKRITSSEEKPLNFIHINFHENNDVEVGHEMYGAFPVLFLEDIEYLDNGGIAGDFFICVFDHEDFTQHTFFIRDGSLHGKGISTISGKPCLVEIIESIQVLAK